MSVDDKEGQPSANLRKVGALMGGKPEAGELDRSGRAVHEDIGRLEVLAGRPCLELWRCR
jgi:hypothetical protein